MRDPDDWWWAVDPRQSLRARTALIFGTIALAMATAIGWTAAVSLRRQLGRQLGSQFEALAVQLGDTLDRALDERLQALQLAARLVSLPAATSSADGRRNFLETVLAAAPDCAWIGLVDRDGQVVAGTQHVFERASVATSLWFRRGQRETFVGDVHEIAELGGEVSPGGEGLPRFLDLAVPVTDPQGKPAGVVGGTVRWSSAHAILRTLVSEVARSEHIGATLYALDGEPLLDSGASGWTRPPDAPDVGNKRGARGYFLEQVAGDGPYLTGYARTRGYRDFHGANWLIAVRQPTAAAFAPVAELRHRLIWIGAGFTAAAAALGWRIAGKFTRRINAVASAADRIRGGDVLTLMPQPRGRDELETMCGELGAMVDEFRRPEAKSSARPRDLSAQKK